MKILILGASGLLGNKLFKTLSKHNEVAGTYFNRKESDYHFLDITDTSSVNSFLVKIKPDVVIHAAAIINADYCEENKDIAKKINLEGTRNVVDACKKNGCKLIFISSDYIFDGENGPYKEDSKPLPVNYYGVTKLGGENIVREKLDNAIILRPTILYGHNEQNGDKTFVTLVLSKLRSGEKIFADNKVVKYPLLIDEVSEAIERLLKTDAKGTYHLGCSEPVTRYQWALKIAKAYGLPETNIIAEESKNKAKKPLNVNLDTSKIEKEGMNFSNVDAGLSIMRNQEGCMFKMIYSVRPDKLILNQNASRFRIYVGKLLAKEHPAHADIVIPIPESGIYAATGYAEESKIPFYFGLIRDYYTQKTLFEPTLKMRNASLKRKLIVVQEIIKDKKVVLVDEAILSGATLNVTVEKLKNSGVKEIHIRIPSPPMVSKCKNRILDINAKLIAKDFTGEKEKLEKELAEHFKVDSLRFLSLESFLSVLSSKSKACVECFKVMSK